MTQKCPSSDELLALSLGQLDEQRSDQITHHLQTCQNCQAGIAALDGDSDTFVTNLREMTPEKFDEDSPYDDEAEAKLAAERAMAAISGAERSDSDLSHVPEVIGEYEIVEVLGQGGMGQVFRGQHVKLKRPVAIKFIAKHRMWDQSTHDRFASEMQAIGGLEHRNIVTAHDAREVDGYAVLVTEFIDGIDVGELLRRKGPLPVAAACKIALEICQALEHCDSRGYVHRDIKPSNMMVSKSGEVKLLDLGLMKLQTEDENGGFTATGQAIGTPDYVAPEQVKDSRTVDIRADLYGLGCSLYKMLTGCVPFPKPEFESAFAKMNAHLSETPIPVSDLRPDLPPTLIKLIGQLLQKNPDLRPQTPSQVKQALRSHSSNAQLSQLVQAAVDLPKSDFFQQQTSAQALVAAKSRSKADSAKTDSLFVLLGVFIWNTFSRIANATKRLALGCWESVPGRVCRWIGKTILSFLTGSDIDWMIIAGLYVLLTPLLFLEADIFNILLVVSHGLFTGWKLKKEYTTQTNYSAVRALMWSAFLVYGTCGLLIASQARSFIQDTLFQHPYFLAPIWDELWFPMIAVVPFVVIASTFLWAVKPAKTSFWRIALLATGWAATLVLLAFFAYDVDHFIRNSNPLVWAWVAFAIVPIAVYCLIKQSERTRWRPIMYSTGWLAFTVLLFLILGGVEGTQRRLSFLNSPQVQASRGGKKQKQITSAQARGTETQIYRLANIAGLSDYQPSDAWCEELEKTLQSSGGWFYAELFLENDPEFAPAMDHHLRKKYDLPAEVKDPAKAWATLERLGRKAVHNGEIKRVVKMVANAIDAEQLNREITKFEPVLRTGGAKLEWLYGSNDLLLKTTDQKSTQLRPLIEAAEAIHVRDELNSDYAKQDSLAKNRVCLCKEVKKGFCSLAYRSAPPMPTFGSNRTYAKSRIAKTLDLLKPNPWSSSFDGDWNHYHLGVEQAPEYDQYLIRRRAWGLGPFGMQLGNTKVDLATYKLLSRQSAGARKWRQENRELLIETALRFFADPPEEVSKDEKVLRSALASIFSGGPSSGPALRELDFLFTDPPLNNQQTLAMEFWPKLDKLLAGEYEVEFPDGTTWAKVAKGTLYEKFTIRMRYLERMWPESTPEMFVETYFKADPTVRQNFLIGRYVSGLSRTIPIAGRLEILQKIQQRVDANAPGDVSWGSDMIHIKKTKTEKESIRVAISKLLCPEGATAYLELHSDELLKQMEQQHKGKPFTKYFPLRPIQEYIYSYPTRYRWRDDLFDLLAKHPNPTFRKDALNTLGNRPRPRFMKVLADLQSDEDAEVRELAEETAERIKGYTIEAYRKKYGNRKPPTK